MSVPLQQQQSGDMTSTQFSNGLPFNQPLTTNFFQESETSTFFDNKKFSVSTDSIVTQLPDELGLGQQSDLTSPGALAHNISENLTIRSDDNAGKTEPQGSSDCSRQNSASAFKHQKNQQEKMISQQYNPSGYSHPRGGSIPQKHSGPEWSHRRTGYRGRSHSGVGRGFPPLKMKQIYVAKPSTARTSATS